MKAPILLLSIFPLVLQTSIARDYPDNSTNPAAERPWINLFFNIGGQPARPHTYTEKPNLSLSLNIERVFFLSDNFLLTGGFGLGIDVKNPLAIYSVLDHGSEDPLLLGDRLLLLPHHITAGICVSRNRKLFIESGLGGTRIYNSPDKEYFLYPLAGLRFHPLERNKMMFRVYGAFPMQDMKSTSLMFQYIGFSFGWSLAKDPD